MKSLTDNYKGAKFIQFDSRKRYAKKEKDVIGEILHITLKDYQIKSKNNTFFSFFKDEDKKVLKNSADELIISIQKDEDNYTAQTGNYIGKFVWNGLNVDIQSRFGTKFLERMLNLANDVYLDDVSVAGDTDIQELDISKYIIYYMFIQNLEKAFLLGLPKAYRSIKYHDMKLKGKIDINRFIKQDIPFKGKVSSISREQKEIQEIIDVLHKAVSIIEKTSFSTKNIAHIKTHLKQYRSNKFISNETINKAIKNKAIQNPIFAPYKKVLQYAKYIINGNNLQQNEKGKEQTYGFLVNVAELFEIYITKLLQKEFSDWHTESPQLRLDKEFGNSYLYSRKVIPDITMTQRDTNDVMVFDTKYKRMKFSKYKGNGSDIDRCDFFQINTYMSYYHNKKEYTLKAGGLLYPIEAEYDKQKCFSDNWFGDFDVKFVIDGIELKNKEILTMDDIKENEQIFIGRIKELINQT